MPPRSGGGAGTRASGEAKRRERSRRPDLDGERRLPGGPKRPHTCPITTAETTPGGSSQRQRDQRRTALAPRPPTTHTSHPAHRQSNPPPPTATRRSEPTAYRPRAPTTHDVRRPHTPPSDRATTTADSHAEERSQRRTALAPQEPPLAEMVVFYVGRVGPFSWSTLPAKSGPSLQTHERAAASRDGEPFKSGPRRPRTGRMGASLRLGARRARPPGLPSDQNRWVLSPLADRSRQ